MALVGGAADDVSAIWADDEEPQEHCEDAEDGSQLNPGAFAEPRCTAVEFTGFAVYSVVGDSCTTWRTHCHCQRYRDNRGESRRSVSTGMRRVAARLNHRV